MSTKAQIRGVVERIVYAGEENNFVVAVVEAEGEDGTVTVAGTLAGLQCGETVELQGEWQTHRQFGRQFKVQSYRALLPSSVHGIRKYLGSGLVQGIGKKYAGKIVDKFGARTLEVIEHDSGRLREVEGIGPKRAREIKAAWDTQRLTREVMVFLQSYGVGTGNCLRLVRRYGNQAMDVLQADPYATAREVDGIGFRTADQIARNLGFGWASEARLDAGILYALEERERAGSTGYPQAMLEAEAARLLELKPEDLPSLAQRVTSLVERKDIEHSGDGSVLQRAVAARWEGHIAQHLGRIARTPSGLPPIKIDKAVEWAQAQCGFEFASKQAAALATALGHKVVILTGGPGTGKTTILRSLVDILRAKKAKIVLASPTGRAAKRMADATRHTASTLHRLLRFDPAQGGFTVNERNPMAAQYVVIDEASMLDSALAAAVLRAIPAESHLLLVGDVNQLPSVGAGNVLSDLIESGRYPVVALEQVFRQGRTSNIITTAYSILGGRASAPAPVERFEQLVMDKDLQFIAADGADGVIAVLRRLLGEWIPRRMPWADLKRDVQVLVPLHRGPAGIKVLNKTLQSAFNPNRQSVSFGDTHYKVGDRVIQLRNNYDKSIYNGDMGIVTHINAEAGTLAADFDGLVVDFERMELADLELAYAISIHKSQGSEFPVVIVPLLKQHAILLQRNLLYTAITRGRKKVFLVGETAAYAMAVRNTEQARRYTGLIARLTAADA